MLLFLYGLQDWPRFQVCLGLWISKVEPSSQRYGPFWHQPQPLDRARPGKGTWKRSQSRSLPCLAKDRRHEQRRFHTDRQQEKVCGSGYSLLSAHLWWPLWWTWTSSGRMWPTWRDPLAQLARGECAANCTWGCLFLFWCKHDRSRSQSCFSHVFTIPTGLPTWLQWRLQLVWRRTALRLCQRASSLHGLASCDCLWHEPAQRTPKLAHAWTLQKKHSGKPCAPTPPPSTPRPCSMVASIPCNKQLLYIVFSRPA